jgi:hypothetical protein
MTFMEVPMSCGVILPPAEEITKIDFEQAEFNAKLAQADFADIKERFGPRTALADFNARVARWATEFTNPRLSRVLRVVGSAMSGDTHEYAVSVNGGIGAGKKGDRCKLVRNSLLWKYNTVYADKKLSYSQFYHWLSVASAAGIIERISSAERQGPDDWNPGAWKPTLTRANFWKVIKDGQVVAHDFFAPLDNPPDPGVYPRVTRNATALATRDATALATGDATHPNESFSSNESPNISSPEEPPVESGKEENEEELRPVVGYTQFGRPIRPSQMSKLGTGTAGSAKKKDGSWDNEFIVYDTGQFWHRKSGEHPKNGKGTWRSVTLSPAEGMFLNSSLMKARGSFPNAWQKSFMLHKAFSLPLIPELERLWLQVAHEKSSERASARVNREHELFMSGMPSAAARMESRRSRPRM